MHIKNARPPLLMRRECAQPIVPPTIPPGFHRAEGDEDSICVHMSARHPAQHREHRQTAMP